MFSPEGMERAANWLSQRLTLSRRIAATMVLSLLAIQLQAILQIRWLSSPEIRLTGVRSLAETVAAIVHETFELPADRRKLLLSEKSQGTDLRLSWSPALPAVGPDESSAPLAVRLSATLKSVLGGDVKNVHIVATTITTRYPVTPVRTTIVPTSIASQLSKEAVNPGEPDVLIPAGMQIWIQGHDGSWIGVDAIGFEDHAFGGYLPLWPLLIGGLIIAIASTALARRVVAPLDRLVIAAGRIGTAREPVRVETKGLHEFSTVARAFEEMQQRLLRFVDDRTQMLAAISHDLRSSLTRMRLTAEQVRSSEEREILSNEIDEMQSMVDSTLAFASGEARLAPNQPTDIAALLISLVDEFTDAGKNCTYSGPNHSETMAHPVALKRAFRNLIDNAIKYGASAKVGLEVRGSILRILITDEGPGIAASSHEDAFAPFRRLDASRNSETPGAGLGLTIARDVVQSHGGAINLGSSSSRGLLVIVELPRR